MRGPGLERGTPDPPTAIRDAIDAHYAPDRVVEHLLDRVGVEISEEIRVIEDAAPKAVAAQSVESEPVVKLTTLILGDAVKEGASHIHLEPGRDGGAVRYRVDGVLRTHLQLPMIALNRVVSRIVERTTTSRNRSKPRDLSRA